MTPKGTSIISTFLPFHGSMTVTCILTSYISPKYACRFYDFSIIDRVCFSCLLLKRRGLATGSLFWGDWLLHHMPWSSSLQTAHYIQNCRHSIGPPPLRFNNRQLEPTRSIIQHLFCQSRLVHATKFMHTRTAHK